MKGILFKPEMIQAIIEGRKTQTRRVIKQLSPEYEWEVIDTGEPIRMFKDGIGGCIFLKPRYQVGETVYIKEAHYRYGYWKEIGARNHRILYRFEPMPPFENMIYFSDTLPDYPLLFKRGRNGTGWYLRSPLFLPEEFARRFITMLEVEAERVQEITPHGCILEGIIEEYGDGLALRDKYEALWDSINPKYLWELNPWEFAYTFEMVKQVRY